MHWERRRPGPGPNRSLESRSRLPGQPRLPLRFREMLDAKLGSLCTSRAGTMNGAPDPLVSAAAANVPRHEIGDLLVGWVRRFLKHCRRRHDLAALAVAALRNILGDPRFLQWVQAIRAQTLNRGDFFARDLRNRRDARAGERAIN